jgi:hypothetical protein
MIRSRWTGGTTFHFVTDGFEAAYSAACEAAEGNGVDITQLEWLSAQTAHGDCPGEAPLVNAIAAQAIG